MTKVVIDGVEYVPAVSAEPQWIVNDLGELGVMVSARAFFLYKGRSIEYIAPHDDGSQRMYRMVGKREFGETVWPMCWIEAGRREDRYTRELTYTPNLSDGKPEDANWRPLPFPNGQRKLSRHSARADPGALEVGSSADGREVAINCPFTPDNGSGWVHYAFTPDQARGLGQLLLKKADEADAIRNGG